MPKNIPNSERGKVFRKNFTQWGWEKSRRLNVKRDKNEKTFGVCRCLIKQIALIVMKHLPTDDDYIFAKGRSFSGRENLLRVSLSLNLHNATKEKWQ